MSTRVGAMSLMITVGLSGYLRPSEMFNLEGGSVLLFPQDPALQSWHERQPFASGLTVAFVGNSGPVTHRSPHLDSDVASILSIIPKDDNSARDHAGTLPDQTLGCVRDLRSQEAAQRRGRWKLSKSIVRYKKSARLTKNFPRILRAPPTLFYTGRTVFLDAMLGRLWEEVLPPCAHL